MVRITIPIVLGILTFVSLLITLSLGLAVHRGKPVFRWHRIFAYLTFILALIHAALILFRI